MRKGQKQMHNKNLPKKNKDGRDVIQSEKEKRDKERLKMKSIVNTLFSTPDGMLFVKEVQKLCKINVVDGVLDHAQLAHKKGMFDMYIKCFYNFIEPETMAKIERLK